MRSRRANPSQPLLETMTMMIRTIPIGTPIQMNLRGILILQLSFLFNCYFSLIFGKMGKTGMEENSNTLFKRLYYQSLENLTLLGLGLIKINNVSANFDNPRPSLILNN